MNGSTNLKKLPSNRSTQKNDAPHPRQQLHDHMTSIHIVYVEQRVAAAIYDERPKLFVLIKL